MTVGRDAEDYCIQMIGLSTCAIGPLHPVASSTKLRERVVLIGTQSHASKLPEYS